MRIGIISDTYEQVANTSAREGCISPARSKLISHILHRHLMVNIKKVNPWKWQDLVGFSQAIEVQEVRRIVYCAGQTSVDENGNPLHKGDMAKQAEKALDNLETVLKHIGLTLSNVVRLNYYTTNLGAFMGASSVIGPRLAKAGCQPSSTLLGVAGLFHPDIMIEIEATAVE